MPVTAADLKFFGSAAMNDTPDGGGVRASSVVQNGTLSNVFPSVSNANRASGNVALRKVYPSVTNADQAQLLGASVAINEAPSDTAVDVWAFKTGGPSTLRAVAAAALQASGGGIKKESWFDNNDGSFVFAWPATWTTGGTQISMPRPAGTNSASVAVSDLASGNPQKAYGVCIKVGTTLTVLRVTAIALVGAPFTSYEIDVAEPLPAGGGGSGNLFLFSAGTVPVYGALAVPTAATTGATSVVVPRPFADLIGHVNGSAYPISQAGLDAPSFADSGGRAIAVHIGDQATLWHEAATTAATAVNGTAINVGRTNVDQIAIVGANGLEIVRFLANGPTPSPVVATVNLAAGTVTPTNVTGWSQPVTVRHRISHKCTITALVDDTVGFSPAITRDFGTNSVLSTHVPLGDLQALSGTVFGQQAWTRQWSDTVIGNPVPVPYSGLPLVTNAGAETDRWAVVFTGATAFDVFSERAGKIASGATTANYAPLNPATGAPYFTLLSAAWASGILVGSVLRFNTTAASGPVWVGRTVAPSTANGTVTSNLRLHGSVD